MKESKTLQNLMNSFAGESQAFQRYSMYSKIAKKEGWATIAAIFDETAANEQQHAKEFYKVLISIVGEDNMPEVVGVNGSYPIAKKTTYDNLMYAAGGEAEEVEAYNEFAAIAEEEGYKDAAKLFKLIATVEDHHSRRYTKIAELLKVEQVLSREERTTWKCMKCGYLHTGRKAPEICPICGHYHGYFEETTMY